jgi:5-methylthioadenosine/S-adenosylhomocysteine deaminase
VTKASQRAWLTRYHAAWVIPVSTPPIRDGTVVVEGDRIVFVGPRADAPPGRDEELGSAILLPGLVNAHTHLDLTVMRGLLEELSFFEWIRTVTAATREVLGDADLLDSARFGIREGLRAGITTYADTSPRTAPFDAMLELGVRGIAFREVFGPDPAQAAESMAGLRDAVAAMRERATPLVRVGVSPHAPYSVSDALYVAVADFARHERLPLATHVAESTDESDLVERGEGPFAGFLRGRGIAVDARGRSPVALLERCGVLGDNALLVHCVRLDAGDIATIARGGAAVAHCPASNAKLGHGVAPVAELLSAGVRVGLGSDSMASNNRMDIIAESRQAALAQRARSGRVELLCANEAVALATVGGARALGLDGHIGTLEPGKQADLAAFAVPDERLPVHDPRDALVWALAGEPAALTVVAGRALVRDGRLVSSDDEITLRVQAAAGRVADWKRARGAR